MRYLPRSPLHDPQRLAALERAGLLDAPPRESLERVSQLGAAVLRVPMTAVTMIDDERQIILSKTGFPPAWLGRKSTPLEWSFCQHVVRSRGPLIVEDTRRHILLRESPLIDEWGAGAYAGLPWSTSDGFVQGAYCALDDTSRVWTDREIEIMTELAGLVTQIVRDRAEERLGADRRARACDGVLQSVSHDLRNPLNAILLGMNLLRELVPEPRAENLLEIVERSASHMSAIITDLLDLTWIDRGHLVLDRGVHAAEELLAEIRAEMEPAAVQKGITLVAAASPGVWFWGDLTRVRRVLGNLVGNALKFTPAGGRVEVRAESSGHVALFSVCDSGPGITTDHLPHVFDRYWQANPDDHQGMGLGLSISKGFVEAHGGEIWVQNEPCGGAGFHFTLPLGATNQEPR